LFWASEGFSQDTSASYPNKPVRIVVPFPSGNLPDVMARLVARRLSESMGQPFIVDNRPGAGGVIGSEAVAKSPPDGYTLLLADVGQWAITPAVYSKLPYDPVRDFAPVARVGTTSMFLSVPSNVQASNIAELVALSKAGQAKMNYGSAGIGSIHHLIFETLKVQTGAALTHVPYKGSSQVIVAMLGGEVSVMFSSLAVVQAHLKSGKMKVLAVATAKRAAQAPNVPTFTELGISGLEFPVDIGILAPAGTPGPIVAKLAGEIRLAANHPSVVEQFTAGGVEPLSDSPEAYAATIRADIAKYARAVKVSGAKVD
jgi:tripartite-type tricarboxylate transporter receptor subunit TctC